MAHFILEYSSNLSREKLQLEALFEQLHNAAIGTELFPLAGIRSRAHPCDDFRVANGDPGFAFAHLEVRIGHGRTDQEKQYASTVIFDAFSKALDHIYQAQGLAISFELNELPSQYKYNQNNLRDYLGQK